MTSKIVVSPFKGLGSEPSAWLEGGFVADMRFRSFTREFFRDEELVEADDPEQYYAWRVGDFMGFLEVPGDADDGEMDRIGLLAFDRMVAEIRKQFPDHELEFED